MKENMFQVKDLIEMLKKEDPEAVVILSGDSEGNILSPYDGDPFIGEYRPDTMAFGEVGYKKLTPELIEQGYTEEDLIEDGYPCIVLYPMR